MATLTDRPLFTRELGGTVDFRPPPGSVYLYAVTTEDRSERAVGLAATCTDCEFVEIREVSTGGIETSVDGHESILVRRADEILRFLQTFQGRPLYIDITGLSHTSWAPLIKVGLELASDLHAVYFEPRHYSVSPTPRLGEFYDLSEKINGVGPLPLMANLTEVDERTASYVALLGFEGSRSAYMFEQVQPDTKRLYPVVGLPGFKVDYPFEAFLGNHRLLIDTKSYRGVRFAKSNCPFTLFYALQDIRALNESSFIRIGMTGTKPHALGALLFALKHEPDVELIYDHVKRKARRTSGTDHCLIYDISDFMAE